MPPSSHPAPAPGNNAHARIRGVLPILLLSASLYAADPPSIPIWPGDTTVDKEESFIGPNDTLRRIRNVNRPSITPMLAPSDKATGAAVIILPGGGFRHLAIDKEGYDVARWLNTMGVAGFVVKYRLTPTGKDSPADRAEAKQNGVADTRAAIRMVRARAKEWNLDAAKIGVIGFSAGGYHAAAAARKFTAENRPDFAICIYPAAPEQLDYAADTPPVFLVHADDDRLAAGDNSVKIYLALKQAKVPAEMHIFARGGHGFGMVKSGAPTDTWTDRLTEWMTGLQLLKRR